MMLSLKRGSSDGSVVLREISTGNEIRTLELGHPVEDIILTSDKVIAISEQNIKVWNIDQTDPLVDDMENCLHLTIIPFQLIFYHNIKLK